MTKDHLTQHDIDEMLSKLPVVAQDVEPREEKLDKTVFQYNFKSQKKLNRGQILLIENLHKRFLRNIEASLTNLLNIPIITNLIAATELSFSQFSESVASPTCLYLLNVSPGGGKVLMEIDSKFAFVVIDKVLGGSSTIEPNIDRELSLIEERVMYRVINVLLRDLEEAWEIVEHVKFSIEGFYSQADYLHLTRGEERIALISVDIRGGEKNMGFINLCLPISALEAIIPKGNRGGGTRPFRAVRVK